MSESSKKGSTWNQILKCIETAGMEHSAEPTSKKAKREPRLQPLTQRLREIEMTYMMDSYHVAGLRKARQLITDLWELHCDSEADIKAESIKLFEQAGMKVYK